MEPPLSLFELDSELLELEPLSELFESELLELEPLSELLELDSELLELLPLELELSELELESELSLFELDSELLELEPLREDVTFDSDLVTEPPDEPESLEELDLVSALGLAVESVEGLLVLAALDSLLGLDALDELEPVAALDPLSNELDPVEEAGALVEPEPPSSELPTSLSVEDVLGVLSAAVIGEVRALSADPADGTGAESWVEPATD